jgi:hypothetical protein
MRRYTEIAVTLVVSALTLAACDFADNTAGVDNKARVRLTVKKSSTNFGPYVMRVNAMSTADLTPDIAQRYGIARSENRGLVNLVVLRKGDGGAEEPIGGTVSVSAANLNGQLKNIELQEVSELADGAGIYYIGVVSVDNREIINFDFDVQPEGSNQLYLIRYTHEFYTK